MAEFANLNMPPQMQQESVMETGVRLNAAWDHQIQPPRWLTGIGKSSEVMSSWKIYLAWTTVGLSLWGSSPRAPPSPIPPPSQHSLCHLSIFIVYFLPFFPSPHTNHTSQWEARPENLPSVEEQQW